jgi:hypothetical protein
MITMINNASLIGQRLKNRARGDGGALVTIGWERSTVVAVIVSPPAP